MKIKTVEAIPLTTTLASVQRTSQVAYREISICLVKVETDTGITGVGECLARFAPRAYAVLIEDLLEPVLIGQDPFSVAELWHTMRDTLNGRSGGILFEAIAGVDIALWDIMGKALDVNVARRTTDEW